MSTDYDKIISQMKEKLDKAKNIRFRAEARLEQLNKQRQELVSELEGLGIKPEELDREISRLRNEIEGMVKSANELLPDEILREKV